MTTTIKAQLQALFTFLSPVPKKANLEGQINGKQILIIIQNNQVKAVKVEGEAVGQDLESAIQIITSLVKVPKNLGRPARVNSDWIANITSTAQKASSLRAGDEIKLRVATSNGKPVCAAVDIYREGIKIGTGGRETKIGFATGDTVKWMNQVNKAVEHAYSKMK